MQKILFVAHCILNTASKVVMFKEEDMAAEEQLRLKFLTKAVSSGIQIVQLPCPEFTLYGAKRWGHVSNQFDNPFFREHCRTLLSPVIREIKEYYNNPERFKILGIVGVDGSPSCGVDYTCYGNWFGSFESRDNLTLVLETCCMDNGQGIFIEELCSMLQAEKLSASIPVCGLFAKEPQKCLSLLD